MAIAIQVLLLFLVGPALAARTESMDGEVAESNDPMNSQRNDCSHLVTLGGNPVSCTFTKWLPGGLQATTHVVEINGKTYVMKETSEFAAALKSEIKIIKKLQEKPQFTQGKIPEYDLRFQAKQPGSEILVMEFLEGWFDLSKQPRVSDPEVRAAAFFLALAGIFNAGVSHCDLNLGNVMFHPSDPTRCKIIDFGMADFNHGQPGGGCIAMNANPDLGYPGTAWKTIYLALGAPRAQGSIYSVCGSSCNTQTKWADIVRQSDATIRSFGRSPQQLQHHQPLAGFKPAVNQQVRDFKPVVDQPVVRQQLVIGHGALTLVKTKEIAEQIKDGTPIKFDGVMGKAVHPKINGQRLTFNFEANDGSKQFGLNVYWASNNGQLYALL